MASLAAEASQALVLGKAWGLDPTYFLPFFAQDGAFNAASIGDTQRAKIGKAAAHVLPQELPSCPT